MLDELFGKVLGLEEEVTEGANLHFNLIEAFENGFVGWQDVKETERKIKADKADLKSACAEFFSEVIWASEQANLTLGEFLDEDKELGEQWGRVEKAVEDALPAGTLGEICCK